MKRALCVGINTYPDAPLQGCVNDSLAWSEVLRAAGFEGMGMTENSATRANILKAIDEMLRDSTANDLFVFTYSGHGTRVPDRVPYDEADRWDEALVPVDYRDAGMITDDDLYERFSGAHARGVRVVVVSDSCHSGSLHRLAPPLQQIELYTGGSDPSVRVQRWLPPEQWMTREQFELVESYLEHEWRYPDARMRPGALTLTACRDDQVTYDSYIDGRWCGAYTYAALAAYRELQGEAAATDRVSYQVWQREIRKRLPSADYSMEPQLHGTRDQLRWLVWQERGRR